MKRENQCTRGSPRGMEEGAAEPSCGEAASRKPHGRARHHPERWSLPQVWELQCECAHRLGTGGSAEKLIKLRFWKDILVSL